MLYSILDSVSGNYKNALENYKMFIIYSDSINNEEAEKKSLEASLQYEFDKKEMIAKASQDKLNVINQEERQKQQIVILIIVGVLILVILFAGFMFNRFKVTQKQTNIIEMQKVLVDTAYNNLHEKNKEVLDSIHYAKRIQKALITSEKYIENKLNSLIKS